MAGAIGATPHRITGRWMGRAGWAALVVPLLFGVTSAAAAGQGAATEYEGAAAVGLALRQLGTTKRVLMIAAHPDDEATQVLSTLALGDGAEVAYLSLTRGEGGQNGIGGELQEGLGLIRSEELLAARRLDGARQYFTRAIDYGFSKDAEEAFRQWPREELLRDVVAVIRHFRPDIIVSVFSGTPRDGHGQHQAAGIMAREGFAAAADPGRFPEQGALGLLPHAVTHLYGIVRGPDDPRAATIESGTFDPLIGRSHFQIAMASRSRHRSQDMGRLLSPGPQSTELTLADTRGPAPGEGLFRGVDTTLTAIAGRDAAEAESVGWAGLLDLLADYERAVSEVREKFNPLRPDRIVPDLAASAQRIDDAIALANRLDGVSESLRRALTAERASVGDALRRAARIEIDAIVADETLVAGQTFSLELRLWNGGDEAVGVFALEPVLPDGWVAVPRDSAATRVTSGALVTRRFDVTVPPDAPATEPYFLELPRSGARYTWPDEVRGVGVPFQDEPVRVHADLSISGARIDLAQAASYQGLDSRSGEFRRPVRVVPAVSVSTLPTLRVLPLAKRGEPLEVAVSLVAEEPGGIAGDLRFVAPSGWRVEPASVPLTFSREGEQRTVEVTLHSPPDLSSGRIEIAAAFVDANGRRFDRGYALIDYPHVRPRPLYRDASVVVQAVDVRLPAGLRVGYIAANGDNVPGALAQLGVSIELLEPGALAAAPLEAYDVVVVGSRAYEGRPDLVTHNQRLLAYARGGGTVIVQYNQYEYTQEGIAPYPVSMARPHDRVTDETAPVTMLEPDHPVLGSPNRITADDFAGWVQERGLYFLNTWDDRYTPLLEMADPGEDPKRGALLVTRVGDGTYVYTGLALFRQLGAGVPGAYRLFANLLALGAR